MKIQKSMNLFSHLFRGFSNLSNLSDIRAFCFRYSFFVAFFLVLFYFGVSCSWNYDGNLSGLHYILNMHDSPAVEAQEEEYIFTEEISGGNLKRGMNPQYSWSGKGSSVLTPPEGSVPRNYTPYPYAPEDFAGARKGLKNQLTPSLQNYERGQKQYQIYCAVCHGFTGLGDGPVTPMVADVPSLMTKKMRGWTDGEIYHIITSGRGRMMNYAAQVIPQDRWKIIYYIRLLQENRNRISKK